MQSRKGMSTAIKIIIVLVVLLIVGLLVMIIFRNSAMTVYEQSAKSNSTFSNAINMIKSWFNLGSKQGNTPKETHFICNSKTLKCEEVKGAGPNQCSKTGESCNPSQIKAYFTFSPEKPEKGQTINFDSSGSLGAIKIYHWDFGDGAVQDKEESTITHTYSNTGNYNVKLTVEDAKGNNDEFSKTISVGSPASTNAPPVAKFIIIPNTAVLEGEKITFDASKSYDNDGYITSYNWDMGNGEKLNGKSVTYSYSKSSTYTVTLSVTDDKGSKGQFSYKVVVEHDRANDPPKAVFSFTPENPTTQTMVEFDARESQDGQGRILHEWGLSGTDLINAEWDFGDGKTGEGWESSHKYTSPGTYNIKLTVTQKSKAGTLKDETTKKITVVSGNMKSPEIANTEIRGHTSGFTDKETILEFDIKNPNTEAFHKAQIGVRLLGHEYSDPNCASDFVYGSESWDLIKGGQTVHFKYTDFCYGSHEHMKFNAEFSSDEFYQQYCLDCPDSNPPSGQAEDCAISLGLCS